MTPPRIRSLERVGQVDPRAPGSRDPSPKGPRVKRLRVKRSRVKSERVKGPESFAPSPFSGWYGSMAYSHFAILDSVLIGHIHITRKTAKAAAIPPGNDIFCAYLIMNIVDQ